MSGSGSLAITTRPRGGDWLDDDIGSLRRRGIDVLVSLLGIDEAHELGLAEPEAPAQLEWLHEHEHELLGFGG